MTVSKDELVAVLRMRYDAYSAEAVFEMACERAALGDKTVLDNKDLAAFRAALAAVGDRVGAVLGHIDDMLASTPAKPAEPVKAEPVKAEPVKPAADKPAPHKAIETTIVLTGIDVGDGDEVLVCGAFPALGDWDPERAKPMARKGDEWLAKLELAPDAQIAFKFLRRTAGGELIWEDGDDRSLVAKPRLEATWRRTES